MFRRSWDRKIAQDHLSIQNVEIFLTWQCRIKNGDSVVAAFQGWLASALNRQRRGQVAVSQRNVQFVERLLHFGRLISGKLRSHCVKKKLGDVLWNGVTVEWDREVERTVRFRHVIVANFGRPDKFKNDSYNKKLKYSFRLRGSSTMWHWRWVLTIRRVGWD